MIFTERTITIRNDSSTMNAPVILYRGDKNVEVRFTLVESPYKYSNRDSINVIESTDASYAQLVIKTPNDRNPIFGDITAVGQSNVIFMIGYDMIDEIEEVGTYDFQIRLFDADQTSMATIPEVTGGFIIKEPIAKEDTTNNITNSAIVGSAVVTSDVSIPTFVGGSYNKTAWYNGTVISRQKLDKIEDGIYETYELSKDNSSQIKEKANQKDLNLKADKTDISALQTQINSITSGSPKGSYANLNALNAALPSGDSNIYLTLDDGKWNYWNGSAWVSGGTYQATNIAEKSVSMRETKYLMAEGTQSKNLFDGELEFGAFVYSNGKKLDSNTSIRNKNMIKVIGGSYITYTVFNGKYGDISTIFEYDTNKNFIKVNYVGNVSYTLKLNEATEYINIKTDPQSDTYELPSISFLEENIQIEYGKNSTSYETPYPKTDTDNIKDNAVTFDKLDKDIFTRNLTGIFRNINDWEQGLSGNDSTKTWDENKYTNPLRILTTDTHKIYGKSNIVVPSEYKMVVHVYNAQSKLYEYDTGWKEGIIDLEFEELKEVGFTLARKNDSAISPSIVENITIEVSYYGKFSLLYDYLDEQYNDLNNKIKSLSNNNNDNNISTRPTYAEILFGNSCTKNVAHMGASSQAPENTIPAYEKAHELGFWAGECDLNETKDGHWILMHDSTVDRTTNGTGAISQMTLEQIKALNIDYGSNIDSYPNLKVPTLEEYLTVCKKYNLVPVMELKSSANLQSLIDIIRKYGMEHKGIILTPYIDTCKAIRKLSKKIPVQFLNPYANNTEEGIKAKIQEIKNIENNAGIDIDYNALTDDIIKYAHSQGVFICTFTLNDESIAGNLINYGIDAITSDNLVLNWK